MGAGVRARVDCRQRRDATSLQQINDLTAALSVQPAIATARISGQGPSGSRLATRSRCSDTHVDAAPLTSERCSSTRSPRRSRPRTSKKLRVTRQLCGLSGAAGRAPAPDVRSVLNGAALAHLHRRSARGQVEPLDARRQHLARRGVDVHRRAHRQQHDVGLEQAQRCRRRRRASPAARTVRGSSGALRRARLRRRRRGIAQAVGDARGHVGRRRRRSGTAAPAPPARPGRSCRWSTRLVRL